MIIRASLPGHVTGLTSSSQVEENSVTVWTYVDTSKQVGDPDHLKVFAGQDDADIDGSGRTILKALRSSIPSSESPTTA